MFKRKLEIIFLVVIVISMSILVNNYYNNYKFNHNDISKEYQKLITDKEKDVLNMMQKNYGFSFKVPLIITDKFKGRLYGLTSYKNGEIKIYLNKKVMKESMKYILDNVIAHEYAHALMFKHGYMSSKKAGHSKIWQQTCKNLGGLNCEQYVNKNDVVMEKMPFYLK